MEGHSIVDNKIFAIKARYSFQLQLLLTFLAHS
jgi:hypothetical protein